MKNKICVPAHSVRHEKGISLISLIVTIITIIILASIVIFNGLKTPDQAQFAKFSQEISDIQEHVIAQYNMRKGQLIKQGSEASDSEIYTWIAAGDAATSSGFKTVSKAQAATQYHIDLPDYDDDDNELVWQVKVLSASEKAVVEIDRENNNIGTSLPHYEDRTWKIKTDDGTVFIDPPVEYDGVKYATLKDVQGDRLLPFRRVDTTKTLAVGDEVEDNENERYFVAKISGGNVLLLTKYNLSKTALEQQNAAYGTTAMAFSTETGWAAGDNLNNRTWTTTGDNAQTASNNAVKRAQAYGAAKGVTGRLMTKEEAADLGCTTSSNSCPDWISGKNYTSGATTNGYLYWWLGSAYNTSSVWYVYGSYSLLGSSAYSDSSGYGVRPVLEVSASDIS